VIGNLEVLDAGQYPKTQNEVGLITDVSSINSVKNGNSDSIMDD